jgi:hypothetical protein
MRSPGRSRLARAKLSLDTTSPDAPGATERPSRMWSRSSRGSPSSGRERSRALAGSGSPGTSTITSAITRVSTTETPGSSATRAASPSGARFSSTKTWAKRWLS